MASDTEKLEQLIAEFDQKNTLAGLLVRYARGRVANFGRRQVMTLTGGAALLVLESPMVSLVAILLGLLGDAGDCLFLRTIPGRLASGARAVVLHRISTVTAVLQAATIAACVALAWRASSAHLSSAFALAYLTGAAINAGIVLPYHRAAAIGRLAVYAVTAVGLFAFEFLEESQFHDHAAFDFVAAMILAYMAYVFVGYVVTSQRTHAEKSRNMLQQSLDLARMNADLLEQQREARNLSLVAKHAHDSVIISDTLGRIQWVNEAFTRITGYSREEARGKTPAALLNAPETDAEASNRIAAAVSQGIPHRAEIMNQTRDGRRIWVETNLVPVLDDAGTVEQVIAVERDITDAKAHAAEMAEARLAAEKGEQAKAQFLATMSHEIRTPMNGIIGMADLLSESDLSRENRHYVETIRRSGEALLTIINDILDFSKLDAGKPATHAVEFALDECIEQAIALLKPQARKKQLFIDMVCEQVLPVRVVGDDGRLRQILINIIGNAIKFTAEGGVTVKISTKPDGGGHLLSFEVRDTGIGIAADRIDHVFDEFAQEDAATTRQFGGTGLGLSISRLLAREMGGDITVTSTPGAGSCFFISLLFGAVQATAPATPAAPEQPFASESLSGKVVLVAEDNRTNRLLVRKYLKDMPLTLLFANNGRQAVEMTRSHQPDIVLMDMSMPEMDGIAATRAIRADAQHQPHIVALTANVFASDKAACLSAGMDGFLTKPLRKGDLLQTLSRAGAASRPPPSLA